VVLLRTQLCFTSRRSRSGALWSARWRAGGRSGARARRAAPTGTVLHVTAAAQCAHPRPFFSSAAVWRPRRAVAKDSGPPPPAVASRGARQARGAREDPSPMPGGRTAASAHMWRPRRPATASSAANGHAPLRGAARGGTPRGAARAQGTSRGGALMQRSGAHWRAQRGQHTPDGRPARRGGRAAHCKPPLASGDGARATPVVASAGRCVQRVSRLHPDVPCVGATGQGCRGSARDAMRSSLSCDGCNRQRSGVRACVCAPARTKP
jgi:hypothetical protein